MCALDCNQSEVESRSFIMVALWDGEVSGGVPSDTLSGDLGGGLLAQFRVRPDVVVAMPPGVEHEAGVRQRRE